MEKMVYVWEPDKWFYPKPMWSQRYAADQVIMRTARLTGGVVIGMTGIFELQPADEAINAILSATAKTKKWEYLVWSRNYERLLSVAWPRTVRLGAQITCEEDINRLDDVPGEQRRLISFVWFMPVELCYYPHWGGRPLLLLGEPGDARCRSFDEQYRALMRVALHSAYNTGSEVRIPHTLLKAIQEPVQLPADIAVLRQARVVRRKRDV